MSDGAANILCWVIFLGVPLVLTFGFISLLFGILAKATGWRAVVETYGADAEPEGHKLTWRTIKVIPPHGGFSCVWGWSTTLVLPARGLYLRLGSHPPLIDVLRQYPPVLIPWSEFHDPRPHRVWELCEGIELSVGNPRIACLVFPRSIYLLMCRAHHSLPRT